MVAVTLVNPPALDAAFGLVRKAECSVDHAVIVVVYLLSSQAYHAARAARRAGNLHSSDMAVSLRIDVIVAALPGLFICCTTELLWQQPA